MIVDTANADIDGEIELVARLMLEQVEQVSARAARLVVDQVPAYAARLGFVVVRDSIASHLHVMFGSVARGREPDPDFAVATGQARVSQGLPLSAVMDTCRISSESIWNDLVATAKAAGISAESALDAASIVMRALSRFTQKLAGGYRDEIAIQVRSEEQRRSALVQALLEGRIEGVSLWDAADVLQLPHQGPYAVIVARVPEVGAHALPRIEASLSALGVGSAWRLAHDVEIGVIGLTRPQRRFDALVATLVETVAGTDAGRVGVSPPYDDLRDTARAVRLARIALNGALDGRPVVVFGRDPLSAAAASAPDIMPELAHSVLSGLDDLPAGDRRTLMRTFGAWLDCDGSVSETAKSLHVHPNTVRYRLRRVEDRTGRSTSRPRDLAILSLAYEVEAAVADPVSG